MLLTATPLLFLLFGRLCSHTFVLAFNTIFHVIELSNQIYFSYFKNILLLLLCSLKLVWFWTIEGNILKGGTYLFYSAVHQAACLIQVEVILLISLWFAHSQQWHYVSCCCCIGWPSAPSQILICVLQVTAWQGGVCLYGCMSLYGSENTYPLPKPYLHFRPGTCRTWT